MCGCYTNPRGETSLIENVNLKLTFQIKDNIPIQGMSTHRSTKQNEVRKVLKCHK